MQNTLTLIILLGYFSLLFLISRLVSRRDSGSNQTFFTANHQSPWWVVAFGMIGASISGVTFISVTGMVLKQDMFYMQMVIGFFFGYLVIAYGLLPIYYKLKRPSIYTLIGERIGPRAHYSASSFFLLSRLLGTAAKLYLVCLIIHEFLLPTLPFWGIGVLTVMMVWIYTQHTGIKTVVWTDVLQTSCVIIALIWILVSTISQLGLSPIEAYHAVISNEHAEMWNFTDWSSSQHFLKQFFSGIFIVIVMTGLDQDMMQKNLTCRNLKEAQKNMLWYGIAFTPLNLLFLCLGILLGMLSLHLGIPIPARGDDLLPMLTTGGYMGTSVLVLFTIGIIAAAFGNADSALTSMTTSCCIDLLQQEKKSQQAAKRQRKAVHLLLALILIVAINAFYYINSSSVLVVIFKLATYTYGPLLGLFAFALITPRDADHCAPYICIASPILSLLFQYSIEHFTAYRFGYEILLVNGLLTWGGLYITSQYKYKKQ